MKEYTEINTYFLAEDGKKFTSKQECENYEKLDMIPTLLVKDSDFISDKSCDEMRRYLELILAQFNMNQDKPDKVLDKVKRMLSYAANKLDRRNKIYSC